MASARAGSGEPASMIARKNALFLMSWDIDAILEEHNGGTGQTFARSGQPLAASAQAEPALFPKAAATPPVQGCGGANHDLSQMPWERSLRLRISEDPRFTLPIVRTRYSASMPWSVTAAGNLAASSCSAFLSSSAISSSPASRVPATTTIL